MVSQLAMSAEDNAIDWDWGQQFVSAGYHQQNDLKDNKMHQVRIGTAMKFRDLNRLPYLGAKALVDGISPEKLNSLDHLPSSEKAEIQQKQKKSLDNRHYMNKLIQKQGQVDFLTTQQE